MPRSPFSAVRSSGEQSRNTGVFRALRRKSRRLSAFQTAWRRERDSNPRYGFPYIGFQDRLFQPLTHPSARAGLGSTFSLVSLQHAWHGQKRRAPGYLLPRARLLQTERARVKLHDLCKVGKKVRNAVIARVSVILVCDSSLLQLRV